MRLSVPSVLVLVPLAACDGAPTPTPSGLCPETDDPVVEVAQQGTWGVVDGADIAFGIPPQGGAPYAPFDLRMTGMPSSDAYDVTLTAMRGSEEVGTGEYAQRFVCANVGDNAGTRFSAELHMRFFGFEPDELADDAVEVTIHVLADDGTEAETSFSGTLDWVLGPMP